MKNALNLLHLRQLFLKAGKFLVFANSIYKAIFVNKKNIKFEGVC